MKKFIYSAVEGEETRIEIDGDVKDVLVAIGEMIGSIYSTYSRHSPVLARFFKFGIQRLANDQLAPTWQVHDLPDGGIEIFREKPKGGTSDGK